MTTQEPSPNEQEFFDVARLIPTADGRRKYLDQVCADDQETRREVEDLLTIYDRDRHFLESPPPELRDSPSSQEVIAEAPGDTIGPYKILEVIGEGGMGNVYMAEQAKPVRRTVALKVIKMGMDSKPVIARFEAERQALALMDHPNVAKFYDAGISTTGSPYFAMELIKGHSIVDYCRQHKLNFSEKLQLFSQVCLGVQHAHQRGIIHRDIKPSNVLVARYDDLPVAKVIDFGVAKAIGERLTDKTMFTRFGQLVGSLEYMSPEQAQLNQLDVDTRTDVYSLGAVLYELLTDEPPFQKEKLSSASLDEALRIIREDEPLKPSDRVSSLAHNSDPTLDEGHDVGLQLDRTLRGELDWIIMKALEKDRTRRYESVSSLATDVQNYLRDQPVSACPPTITYRFGKFARRNKVIFLAASVAAVVLFLGAIGLVVSNRLISEQRDEANRQREIADENFHKARDVVDKYLMKVSFDQLLKNPELHALRKELITLAKDYYLDFVEHAADDPQVYVNLSNAYTVLGSIEKEYGSAQLASDYERLSFDVTKRFYDQDPANPRWRKNLAISYVNLFKQGAGGLQELRKAQELLAPLVSEFPLDEGFQYEWGDLHYELGLRTGAIEDKIVARDTYGRLMEMKPDWAEYKYGYALATWEASGRDFSTAQEAIALLQEAVKDAPKTPRYWKALAEVLSQTDPADITEGELALEMRLEGVRAFQRRVDIVPTHEYFDGMQRGWMSLGEIQRKLGRWDDALKSYEEAAQSQKKNGGGNAQQLVRSLYWVGEMQRELGRISDAAASYQEACVLVEQIIEDKTGQDLPLNNLHVWAEILVRDWAGALHELERYDELEQMLTSRLSRRQNKNDPASLMDVAGLHVMLGLLMDATQRTDDAVMQYRMAITSSKKAFEFEPRYKGVNPQPWSVAAFMLYRRSGWVGADTEARVAIETTCVPDVLAAANDDWKPRLELMFAPLYWLAGEGDEYRRICRSWIDAADKPPAFSILARMVSLDPKCLEMGSDLLALAPEVSPESSRNARESYGSLHHARGRVLYRTGDCELAIESLNKASDRTGAWGQRNPSHPPDALVHLDLALAHHFNGNSDLAQEFLEKATVEMDSNEFPWQFCDSGEAARLVLPFQLYEMKILRLEAEQLILNSEGLSPGEASKSPIPRID